MNELNGYVKLHRKMREWEWYSDTVVKVVFLELLMTANFKKTRFRGRELLPGQTVVSAKSLANTLGLTIQQVKTALTKLKQTGEITTQSTNRFTLITVENWGDYQCDDIPSNQQTTNKQPTNNQQTTNKQPRLKNDKKERNIYIGQIVDYLNEKTGKKYRANSEKTRTVIQARLNDGYTVEDFKTVIDTKYKEWRNTEWEKFLRPSTLFSPKFEEYLNQAPKPKPVRKEEPTFEIPEKGEPMPEHIREKFGNFSLSLNRNITED